MSAGSSRALLAELAGASREASAGRRVNAVLTYEKIATMSGLEPAVNVALADLAMVLDNHFQAIGHLEAALESDPGNALYLCKLGIALHEQQRVDEAKQIFERALAIDPNQYLVLNGLGAIHLRRGDFSRARELLEKAAELKPSSGEIRMNLAQTLIEFDEHDEALKQAGKALKLGPGNLNAQYTYGIVLAQLGRVEDAVRHFEKIIRTHRQCGDAYDHLARLKKFSPSDKKFIDGAEAELQRGMPARDRICLHFALGKMHDDCQEWDRAFDHYRQANLLKKREYDLGPERKNFARLRKFFTADKLRDYQKLGNSSETPVFIVGMPRSGTTLMERMIASCENAAGAGELPEIPRIAKALGVPAASRNFIATLKNNLTRRNIERYADEYLDILQQAGPTADRVVDKLPGNFYFLWLIAILFPKARIIFAMRHPLDVCLSCHFQNFDLVPWTYDLELTGDVYCFHREVMDYWTSVLPAGQVLPIQYEQLVDEPEIVGKRMIEHCGLEWRGDGLANYKKERVVKTASLWQVRQPVYQSSRMRWKNYASHLSGLAAQLSDFLQDDRESLAEHDIDISQRSGFGRFKRLFG